MSEEKKEALAIVAGIFFIPALVLSGASLGVGIGYSILRVFGVVP